MATNFPTSLDSLTNPASSDQLNNPSHSAQHANANDAIEQLQAKVGINGSAITTSHDYKISQLEAAIAAGSSGTKLIYQDIRNQSGSSLSKGTPVRVTGSDGASGKLLVASASNSSESDSSKTFGLTSSTVSNNSNGQVVTNGLLEGIDTTGAVDGDPVWLGVNGAKIYGIANKPVAPAHLVYLGVVVRGGQQNTGSIFVSIQNGFEIQELHNVLINNATLQNKDALVYDSTTQLWKNYDLSLDFVSSSDVQNSLGDYIPLNTLGNAGGPAELDIDGNLLIPENKIIIEGATADAYELTIQAPDVASDITVTLPNAAGTLALTSDISTAISNLVSSAPSTLDTLNELATALGNDANFSTTVTNSIGNKVSKSGGDTITASTASTNGLIIKGATSQTADLQQWQDSAGNIVARVYSNGAADFAGSIALTGGGSVNVTNNIFSVYGRIAAGGQFADSGAQLESYPSSATKKGIVIKGFASQTADLQQWQNSSGTILARINSAGVIGTTQNVYASRYYFSNNGTDTGTSISFMDGSAGGGISIRNIDLGTPNAAFDNIVPLTVAGNINQTANLQEWKTASGTVLAKVDKNGSVIGSAISSSGTGSITTDFYVGNQAYIYGAADYGSALNVRTRNATAQGIIVRGVISQTGNLQEWQNSSGTILASINSAGKFVGDGSLLTGISSLPSQTSNSGKYLTTDGTVASWATITIPPGSLYQADAPTSPAVGQIWVESDSTADSFDPNIVRRHTFTATAGQTNFVASVTFVDGYEQVYFNGLLLLKTTDYTTSGGNTVILTTAAAVGDIVEIVTVTNLNSVNTYTQAEIDSKIATEVNNLVASAPAALNTLDELAQALNDDANFATTVTNSLATKKTETASSISTNTNLTAGVRYFVTSASALTLTLPANPTVNDQIEIFDASGNASTYNITVARNGKLLNGTAGNLIIDVNGGWFTLVFTGNTYGWKVA